MGSSNNSPRGNYNSPRSNNGSGFKVFWQFCLTFDGS